MKNITTLILAFTLLIGNAFGAVESEANSVTLGWDANSETDLVGYRVYFSKNASEWTHAKDVGLVTQATVSLPSSGTWFFIVTAKNAELESLPSEVVSYTTPSRPGAPGSFRIVSASAIQVSTVTTSTNLILVP